MEIFALRFLLPDALLLDGRFEPELGLLVADGRIRAVLAAEAAPAGASAERLEGLLAPGYVEIQVNGCGGGLFSRDPTAATIERMDDVLAAHGVTSFLPTLITATTETIEQAIAAVRAVRTRRPSVRGLHLEGPHLGPARPGTHDPSLIRPMSEKDLTRILAARDAVRLVTVAPESVTPRQIEALVEAGIVVALGHTGASAEEILSAHRAGASMLTHLFNAMPPFAGRDPGPVGALFASPSLAASIIADGVHVADTSVLAAAHALGERLVLTSDATASIEGGTGEFVFGGYRCRIEGGAVRNHDGQLAGAAILLDEVVQRTAALLGDAARAVRMAGEGPARLVGLERDIGRLVPGARADLVLVDRETLALRGVWRGGEAV